MNRKGVAFLSVTSLDENQDENPGIPGSSPGSDKACSHLKNRRGVGNGYFSANENTVSNLFPPKHWHGEDVGYFLKRNLSGVACSCRINSVA